MLKACAIQFDPHLNDLEGNRKKVEKLLTNAIKETNAKLYVLPELAFSGYNFQSKEEVEQTGEPLNNSESCEMLKEIASRFNIYIVTGINEREKNRFFNSAVAINKNGIIMIYRKLQLYAKEKEFFTPGNKPLQIFSIDNVKIGVMICFDWFFPEIPRTLALKGVHVICHPMNAVIPDGAYLGDNFHSKWNRVYIILSNRIGLEGDLTYIGRSRISDPTGKVIVQASADSEEIISAELDPKLAENKNLNNYNHLFNDRRPEFYFK
ncbi:MAG: nitrilase-related carbon-nitrogen hydrolase [Candidatus Hodarchaeota archaeon]